MPAPSLLAPADLGLPEKFTGFRRNQDGLILNLAESDKRFSALSVPTGGGKSLIYAGLAKFMNWRTLILVGTKGLQSQLMTDFAAMGLFDMRGQANYPCVAVRQGGFLHGYAPPNIRCNEGPCKVGVFCPLKKDGGCEYYDARAAAAKSKLVVTNYSYWLTVGRQADPLSLGLFDLLVLDEAHTAPNWLAAHCTVELDRSEVRTILGMELPPVDEGVEVWATWAAEAAGVAKDRYKQAKAEMEQDGRGSRLVHRMLRLQRVESDLIELSKAHAWRNGEGPSKDVRSPGLQTDWVAQVTDHGAKFSPVWAHPYAEQYLFRGAPRIVMSSATITPDIYKYLGINPAHADWHEVKSGFDPRRRPFVFLPTVRVDRRMLPGEEMILVNRIDKIIEGRTDRKGIIHTVSYSRAKMVLEKSKYAHMMIGHDSRDTRAAVERFKRSADPVILVSPAMVEGFDFPADECRYQILIKIPFIDGRDPVEKERRKSDKGWPNYCAALALIQTAGRGMRSADDICETFILDEHWWWFKKAVKFPGWFRAAWRVAKIVPPAIPLDMKKGGLKVNRGT